MYIVPPSSPPPSWSTLFPSSSLWCKPQFWPIGLIHPPSIGLKDSSARSSFALNIITSEEKCTHLFQALFKKNGGASEAQKGLFSKHLKLLSHTKYSCYKVLFETLFPFGRAGFFCCKQKIRLMMSWAAKKWMYNLTQNGHPKESLTFTFLVV